MRGEEERRTFQEQRADLYEVIDRLAAKLIEEGQEKATIKFGRLCAKAEVNKPTLMRNDVHYALDQKDGVSYHVNKGELTFHAETWKERRENHGNWKG